ncbi:MAG: type II secretion system GspH family protein [Planctomycetes bacterium]|nr:type II secretion system GspH family protein [Planctomycetota bacterium]
MRTSIATSRSDREGGGRALTLAELLVVVGVIALLISVMFPPLELARRQAMRTQCSAQLQQLGLALESARSEYEFYPLWDDRGTRFRYTWIDVLVQRRFLGSYRAGYCPDDLLPDPLNEARGRALNLIYPRDFRRAGVDYSYGINAVLSAGSWAWRPGHSYQRPLDERWRRFEEHERSPSRRVLAGDANWSTIYNLSGDAIVSGVWNDPTQYDNTVGYRHPGWSANLLKQDGHVERASYNPAIPGNPISTGQHFVWYPNEPLTVNPDDQHGKNYYPDVPPPFSLTTPVGNVFPDDLVPQYYTKRQLWTLIEHKYAHEQ